MSDVKEYIRKIVDDGNVEEMYKLSDILDEVIEIVSKYDKDCYDKYKMELYKMAYGNTFNKQMAEEIVSNMKPYGERWKLEETQQIQRQYGLDNIKPTDFYIVINSAYNDYQDLFQDNMEMYVKFTNDFINDEDANRDKVFVYFTTIPM